MKRTISALIAAALIVPSFPALADTVSVSDTVSGYVSCTGGDIEIASKTKTPTIYVDDENDYAGVARAANDLKTDIESVTGVSADITDTVTVSSDESGVKLGKTPTLTSSVSDDAQGIIAVYSSDGVLSSVHISKTYADGKFTFDDEISLKTGETVKGMVWSEDMKPLTPVCAAADEDISGADIIIGTIGKSDAIDTLAADGRLDTSEIDGEWEAFTVQNVDGVLVIAGADKRGTIYGLYDLSEKMGVSPWEWWADVTPKQTDAIYVTLPDGGYTEGSSSVKYRGIFINQEYNLWNWSKSISPDGKGMDTEAYEKIFELLLRLKANYLWPAMHDYTEAFNVNPENAAKAEEYGIVMGSSHCEMLLRNNMGELLTFQEKWIEENPDKNLYMFKDGSLNAYVAYDYTDTDADGNTVYNKEFLEDYWRERVRANKDYESNFTIGMRGVHDGSWSPVNASTTEEKIALLEEIIAKQRQILSEEIGKPADEIPQTFIPYKEILELYNAGLSVPDDVTIMWTNDNYGHIRQSSTESERERSGGGGMYYHVSYYGRPSSVIWNGGTQPGLIKEEMTKAYNCGADTVWVLNVGPLKGFENQTEYFLDLGRNIDAVSGTSVSEYVSDNAKRYFGFNDTQAREYADIQCEFLETANSRRPDFQTQGIYSLTAYGDEGQKTVDKYAELIKRSETLYDSLPDDLKPAFYELQLYAVKSAYNVTNAFVSADKSKLYGTEGRGSCVNKYAALSNSSWAAITTDTDVYNSMLDGKWKNAVNPFQKEESGSWDIMRNWKADNSTAETTTVSTLPYTEMGIAVENQSDISSNRTLEFSGYTKDVRFIDIFNKGAGSLDWKITSSEDWVTFNKTSGTVYDDDRIYAGIDWDNAPTGANTAQITVTRYIGTTAVQSENISVTLNNDTAKLPQKTYAEANGYVSVEAEHYTTSVTSGDYAWIEQDDFGRSGTSMKFMPDTAESASDNGAYLEYDVNFDTTGTFNVDLYRMPTLNERGTIKFAVGIDDNTPVTVSGNNKYYNNSTGTDAWGKSILNNIEVLTAKITVDTAGIHKIRLYGIDPGAVIDKFVVTTGTKYTSFYGAPESYNTTYNSVGAQMPDAADASDSITGDVTALFNPTLYTVSADISDTTLVSSDIIKIGSAEGVKITAAAYASSGVMLSEKTIDYDFSDTELNEKTTVPIDFAIPSGAAEVQVIVYDDTDTLNALSPALTENVESISTAAAYDNGTITLTNNLDDYIGKEAICTVTNDEDVFYIRQETVSDDTFKTIYTSGLDGQYTVKVSVSGEGIVTDENVNTVKNISPDNAESTETPYSRDFSSDNQSSGGITAVLGGNAVYDSTNGAVQLTGTDASGGTLDITLSDSVKAVQGKKVTVVSKIAYGKQSGKYTDYVIKDSNGNELVKSHISVYSSTVGSISIGGTEVKSGLSSGDGIKLSKTDNLGINNGYSTYTTVFDPDTNTITLTVSNSAGSSTMSGKFPAGSSYDIAEIYFSTTHTYSARSSYVDDVSISVATAQSYNMTFNVTDGSEALQNASITVTDKKYGTVILPDSDGVYKLCDGVYSYTVTADGYTDYAGTLELSQATESKTINVVMESDS